MSPSPENLAKRRFFILQIVRFAGAALALLGLAIVGGRITGAGGQPLAPFAGYVLVVVGAFDVMAVPVLLARAWKRQQP